MPARLFASLAAAEPLLSAGVVGIGLAIDSTGLAAFGALWWLTTFTDRIRRRA